MKAERIKVVKNWPKSKSICNISVFLGFTNFYYQFIQSFNKIAVSLTSFLKTTGLSNDLAFSKNDNSRPAFSRNNGSRLAFNKNNGSRPVSSRNNGSRPASSRNNNFKPASSRNDGSRLIFERNNSDGKFEGFGGNDIEYAKKSEKSKKLFKSQKSAKSRKNLSKSGNSPSFDTKDNGLSFLAH